MISKSSQPENPSAILQALCQFDLSPWCYVPQGGDAVTCASQRFLGLWGLDQPLLQGSGIPRDTTASIPLQTLARAAGAEGKLLERVMSGEVAFPATGMKLWPHNGASIKVTCTCVHSDDATVLGRLFMFQAEIPGMISDRVVSYVIQARQRLQVLSARESQVLHFLFFGCTNKAIGLKIVISEKTVEKHRARIMQKLKVSSTAELIRLTFLAQLIDPTDPPPPAPGKKP